MSPVQALIVPCDKVVGPNQFPLFTTTCTGAHPKHYLTEVLEFVASIAWVAGVWKGRERGFWARGKRVSLRLWLPMSAFSATTATHSYHSTSFELLHLRGNPLLFQNNHSCSFIYLFFNLLFFWYVLKPRHLLWIDYIIPKKSYSLLYSS